MLEIKNKPNSSSLNHSLEKGAKPEKNYAISATSGSIKGSPMKHPARKTLGYQLILAARAHRTRIAARLHEIGLFPGQEQALKVLGQSSLQDMGDDPSPADGITATEFTATGMTMGALARLMRVRPPTISKTIARLEAQGLVLRKIDPKDGRIVTVALTDLGRSKLAQIEQVLIETEDAMRNELDSKDIKRLSKLLRKLSKALSVEDRFEQPDEPDLTPDD
jgi:DNA-binding MarR family transcriptional regulator